MKHLFTVIFALISLASLAQKPLFTTDLVALPSGELALANRGDRSITILDTKGKPVRKIALNATPTGITCGGGKIYVTTFDLGGFLNVIDSQSGAIESQIPVGHYPVCPILNPQGTKIVICNQYQNQLQEIDLQSSIRRTVSVIREPKGAVFAAGKLWVTNFLPLEVATNDYVSSMVSVIDPESFTLIKNIKLANGSNALRGITATEDYVLVSHNLGRFQVPTSQLQQGWMNTSAMSVIDARKAEYIGAVVVDEPERGAAGIWDIKSDATKIYISHSGTHELSVIDYPAFKQKLESYPGDVETLAYDLRFMYGLRHRVAVHGNGPRQMALTGDKLYIPTYFSDSLNIMTLNDEQIQAVALVKDRVETPAERGERIFNDATYCFQSWQSCNGCHPGDARTDGMNWDLMNDGIGNPKNCKSLLYSLQTPPSMISGIRVNAELANRKGFTHIQFYEIPEQDALAVDEYVRSLEAVPSPYLVDGKLSEKAELGRKVFEKFACDACHSGPYYTDGKLYRIGPDVEFEAGWDTPTLRESWRTAPYLFNGRAVTMRDVFETHRHGIDKKISSKEIDQLVEYVNSL